MGHAEGSGVPGFDAVRDRRQRGGGDAVSSAKAPTMTVPKTRSPGGDGCDVSGHLEHLAGELAAGNEGRRDRDLVLVGNQQHIGEVDGRRLDFDHHGAGTGFGCGQVHHLDHLGWPVLRTEGGPHLDSPTRPRGCPLLDEGQRPFLGVVAGENRLDAALAAGRRARV